MSVDISSLIQCVNEIIAVMEKHEITISNMDGVLEQVRGTVYSDTYIKSRKE